MSRHDFARALAGIFEKSPWIPELAWRQRPFKTLEELHAALCLVIREAGDPEKLALIRCHPELADPGQNLTRESESEQRSASLGRLAQNEAGAFADLNQRYRRRFGFPFVICVRQHDRQSILKEFNVRLHNTPAIEMNSAIDEICKIAYFRLQRLLH
ncbi:MAG TPA: 2-oxo-4-hydroxy-4-carboxy-5-ureidoimidazoline decarboxylase [Acidobacteriota bacterium]